MPRLTRSSEVPTEKPASKKESSEGEKKTEKQRKMQQGRKKHSEVSQQHSQPTPQTGNTTKKNASDTTPVVNVNKKHICWGERGVDLWGEEGRYGRVDV